MHGLTGVGDVTGLVILLRTENNGQKASCGVAVTKMAQPRDVRLGDILRRLSQRSVHGTRKNRWWQVWLALKFGGTANVSTPAPLAPVTRAKYTSNTWCGSLLKMQLQHLMKSTR